MGFLKFIRSLIRANTLDSSKSFALVVSVLVGAAIGVSICFCLVWDVVKNGKVTTDLESLGIFLLCVGGFMAGGGINKAIAENRNHKNGTGKEITPGYPVEQSGEHKEKQ